MRFVWWEWISYVEMKWKGILCKENSEGKNIEVEIRLVIWKIKSLVWVVGSKLGRNCGDGEFCFVCVDNIEFSKLS